VTDDRGKGVLDRILKWLDDRIGIYGHTIRPAPKYAYRLDYWLGSFVLASFILEVVTGALLALYYVPADPYKSTVYLIQQVPFGALLFSVHSWGAYAMVFFLLVHMTRNFVVGASRKPREIMWIVGAALAGLTLTEAFIGYSLPYNLISWTATTTGLNLFTYMPFGLSVLISQFTIVPTLPGLTQDVALVDRFFVFHWIVGGLIMLFVALHLYIFEKHGITPPLTKEEAPELLDEYGERLERDPDWKLQPLMRTFGIILMTFLMAIGGVVLLASLVPFDIGVQGGQLTYLKPEYNAALAAQTPPIPDWYFLFVYFFYKSVNPVDASWIFLGWTAVTVLFPFIDQYVFRHKAPHPVMRPAAIALGTGFIVSFIVNSVWAYETPGRDIGPIGVEVDAVIFAVSFLTLFPLLKFVLQPRALKGYEPIVGGGVKVRKLNFMPGMSQFRIMNRVLQLSFLGLLSAVVYLTLQSTLVLIFHFPSWQLYSGALIGTDMLAAGTLIGLLVFFGGDRR